MLCILRFKKGGEANNNNNNNNNLYRHSHAKCHSPKRDSLITNKNLSDMLLSDREEENDETVV